MRKIRTDIWKSGPLPSLTWCIGFNVVKKRQDLDGDESFPNELGIYVNYRGKAMRLDRVGLLHVSEWPEYWIELEEKVKQELSQEEEWNPEEAKV